MKQHKDNDTFGWIFLGTATFGLLAIFAYHGLKVLFV